MFQPSVEKRSKRVMILLTVFSLTTTLLAFSNAQQESSHSQIHLKTHEGKASSIDSHHQENEDCANFDGRGTDKKSEKYNDLAKCEKQVEVDGKVECPSITTDHKYEGPKEENVMYATSSSSSIFSMEVLEDVLDQVEQSGAKVMKKLGGVMDQVTSSKDKMMEKLDNVMDRVSESGVQVIKSLKSSKTLVMEELDHIIDEVSHSKVMEEIRALPREIRESFVLSVRNRSYVAAGVMVAIATAILVGGAIYFAWCHHDALDYHIMAVDEPGQPDSGESPEINDNVSAQNGTAKVNGSTVPDCAEAGNKNLMEDSVGNGTSETCEFRKKQNSDITRSIAEKNVDGVMEKSKEELLISKYTNKSAQSYGMYDRENPASPCACTLPHSFPHTSAKKCEPDEIPMSQNVTGETVKTSNLNTSQGVIDTVEESPRSIHRKLEERDVFITPDTDMVSQNHEESLTEFEMLEPNPVMGPEYLDT